MIKPISMIFMSALLLFLSRCDLFSDISEINNPETFHRVINNEHPFEIKECHVLYKGERLDFDVPIEEWISVIDGKPRQPEGISFLYVWDDFGVTVRLNSARKTVTGIEWLYDRELPDYKMKMNPKNHVNGMMGVEGFIEMEGYNAKGRFSKSIILDGILMDHQFNIHELNQSRMQLGLSPFQESMWGNQWVNLRRCGRMELNFSVDPNDDDDSKVDSLSFGISWLDEDK